MCHVYVRLSVKILPLKESDRIFTCNSLILRALMIVLSSFSSLSCNQVSCICKIIPGIIAVIGKGLGTYMHLPYSQGFRDSLIYL